MITTPIYLFRNADETGISEVPINGSILVLDDGDGKKRHIIKKEMGIMNNRTTLSWFLSQPSMYIEFLQNGISISDITGFNIAGISDGQLIEWDDRNSKFIPSSRPIVQSVNNKSGNVILDLDSVPDGNRRRLLTQTDIANRISLANLSDLSDIDLLDPQNGDILTFDGAKWINSRNDFFELDNISINKASLNVNDIIKWDGTKWIAAQIGSPTTNTLRYESVGGDTEFEINGIFIDYATVSSNGVIDDPERDYSILYTATGSKVVFTESRERFDIIVISYTS